jgi:hypothetical protein
MQIKEPSTDCLCASKTLVADDRRISLKRIIHHLSDTTRFQVHQISGSEDAGRALLRENMNFAIAVRLGPFHQRSITPAPADDVSLSESFGRRRLGRSCQIEKQQIGPKFDYALTPNLAAKAFTASLAIFFASASVEPLLTARL